MTTDQTYNSEKLLLRTKLTAPIIAPEFVRRPRLTSRIDRGIKGPLTLISAPAGFGKTNLLVEWYRQQNFPVAWLNIDSADNDLPRFFRYVIGALQTVEPGLGMEALDFFETTHGGGLDIGRTLLINEISAYEKDIVLVLDDFQALDEDALTSRKGLSLKYLPRNLHLIMATRAEPRIDLTFLRSKGWITEIGMKDLRFTAEEVGLFFHQTMDLQLPPETIAELEMRTEGWVTGLQMAAISLRHQTDPGKLFADFQGDAHYLVDFLAEEVLDRQPEEIRQFLLRSSILDMMTGSLCEAVVKPDAQPGYGTVMLNQLEHARLFLTAVDEKRDWYRYHHLFGDFLRHILAEINPGEIPELYKRAALWCEQNSSLDEAFQYAIACGDVEWAANLIERNVATMIRTGEIFSLMRWSGKLSNEMIKDHPYLGLTFAWGSIAAYKLDDARILIENIKKDLDLIEKQNLTLSGNVAAENMDKIQNRRSGLWNIRGGLAICQSVLALLSGETEKAADFSREAASYLGEENPFIRSWAALDDSLYHILSGDTRRAIDSLRETIGVARQANNPFVLVISTCQLAEMQALQGELSKAWTTLQKAQYMASDPEGKPLSLAGLADTGFGEILLERNQLSEARVFLERGIEAAGSLWWLNNLDGMISMARLRTAHGDFSTSQAFISQPSGAVLNTDSKQWDDVIVSAIAVRLALYCHDLASAIQLWKKNAFPDFPTSIPLKDYPYHIYEYVVLTQARLLAEVGKNQGNRDYQLRSIDLAESLLLEAKRFQRVTSQIEILVSIAVVQFDLGRVKQAAETFQNALLLGESEGFRRIFLEGGSQVVPLLKVCISAQEESRSLLPSRTYMESLLDSYLLEGRPDQFSDAPYKESLTSPAARTEDDGQIFLSSREIEVLKLIAEGLTNQEISSRLFLAINTVKRHAYNIYAKLNVEKRTQAVSKARRLGLIP